jgi:predicted metal-dependent hydrolase
VGDFTRQEAEHGRLHTCFNEQLRAQGVKVERIEQRTRTVFQWYRKYLPRGWNLALTAAAEHMTAIMSHEIFSPRRRLAEADRRLRALYFWHGVEEIEHKAVAFDVMQRVAGVGYAMRAVALLYLGLLFPLHVMLIMRHMLRIDGFTRGQRLAIWARGLRWLYGRGGLCPPLVGPFFAYLRPGFHPWDTGLTAAYARWHEVYSMNGDPIAAADAIA